MQQLHKHEQQRRHQNQEVKGKDNEEEQQQQPAKRRHQIDSSKIIKPIDKASVLFSLDNLFLY